MVVLTDDAQVRMFSFSQRQQDPNFQPTKQNILNAVKWLVSDAKAGDSLWFSYSGHGTQVVDTDGDEDDGYDEA